MGRNCRIVADPNRARASVMWRSTSCSITGSPPASDSNRDSSRRSCSSTDCTPPSKPVRIDAVVTPLVSPGEGADVDGWTCRPQMWALTDASAGVAP
jgi:hypothetical protein